MCLGEIIIILKYEMKHKYNLFGNPKSPYPRHSFHERSIYQTTNSIKQVQRGRWTLKLHIPHPQEKYNNTKIRDKTQ